MSRSDRVRYSPILDDPHGDQQQPVPLPDFDAVVAGREHTARRSAPSGGGVRRRTALGAVGAGAATAAVAAALLERGQAPQTALSGAQPAAARGPASALVAGSAPPGGAGSGPGAGPGMAPVGAGGAKASTSKSPTEYQAAAGGRAPRAAVTARPRQAPTLLPLNPQLHILRRATWGITPTDAREIRRLGTKAWLDRQLRPSRIPDDRVNRLLRSFDTLGKTPQQLRAMNKEREKQDYFYAHTQLENAAILRAAWSNRQLYEVLVDFFHSRLHVPGHFDKTRDALNHYDVAVIRKHALGRFSDMVWAMVTHPAMIVYLDNQNNRKDGGNQNLGRELLELHTLGVDAGYRQSDVAGAALLLTGLSVDNDTLRTVFRPDQHHVGRVRVFGKVYANASAAAGMRTLRALVNDLTHHPKTAQYLALDLARRFVSDAPPAALVQRLAQVYLRHDTAIVPVLRALFASPEFATSVGAKYRRPLENTVATIRSLGVQPRSGTQLMKSLGDLRYNLERAGQSPLGRSSPDGYPDFARPWLSSVGTLARWNIQMSLAGGWRDGLTKPDVDLMLRSARTYGQAVDVLLARLLFQKGTPAQRAALLAFLGKSASAPLSADAKKNDYNLRVRVPALILGAPNHQLR